MAETVTIDLGDLPPMGPLHVVDVRSWDPASHAAVLGVARDGVRLEMGLVADLDRRTFLNRPEDAEKASAFVRCEEALPSIAADATRLWAGMAGVVEVDGRTRHDWVGRVEAALSHAGPRD